MALNFSYFMPSAKIAGKMGEKTGFKDSFPDVSAKGFHFGWDSFFSGEVQI